MHSFSIVAAANSCILSSFIYWFSYLKLFLIIDGLISREVLCCVISLIIFSY